MGESSECRRGRAASRPPSPARPGRLRRSLQMKIRNQSACSRGWAASQYRQSDLGSIATSLGHIAPRAEASLANVRRSPPPPQENAASQPFRSADSLNTRLGQPTRRIPTRWRGVSRARFGSPRIRRPKCVWERLVVSWGAPPSLAFPCARPRISDPGEAQIRPAAIDDQTPSRPRNIALAGRASGARPGHFDQDPTGSRPASESRGT